MTFWVLAKLPVRFVTSLARLMVGVVACLALAGLASAQASSDTESLEAIGRLGHRHSGVDVLATAADEGLEAIDPARSDACNSGEASTDRREAHRLEAGAPTPGGYPVGAFLCAPLAKASQSETIPALSVTFEAEDPSSLTGSHLYAYVRSQSWYDIKVIAHGLTIDAPGELGEEARVEIYFLDPGTGVRSWTVVSFECDPRAEPEIYSDGGAWEVKVPFDSVTKRHCTVVLGIRPPIVVEAAYYGVDGALDEVLSREVAFDPITPVSLWADTSPEKDWEVTADCDAYEAMVVRRPNGSAKEVVLDLPPEPTETVLCELRLDAVEYELVVNTRASGELVGTSDLKVSYRSGYGLMTHRVGGTTTYTGPLAEAEFEVQTPERTLLTSASCNEVPIEFKNVTFGSSRGETSTFALDLSALTHDDRVVECDFTFGEVGPTRLTIMKKLIGDTSDDPEFRFSYSGRLWWWYHDDDFFSLRDGESQTLTLAGNPATYYLNWAEVVPIGWSESTLSCNVAVREVESGPSIGGYVTLEPGAWARCVLTSQQVEPATITVASSVHLETPDGLMPVDVNLLVVPADDDDVPEFDSGDDISVGNQVIEVSVPGEVSFNVNPGGVALAFLGNDYWSRAESRVICAGVETMLIDDGEWGIRFEATEGADIACEFVVKGVDPAPEALPGVLTLTQVISGDLSSSNSRNQVVIEEVDELYRANRTTFDLANGQTIEFEADQDMSYLEVLPYSAPGYGSTEIVCSDGSLGLVRGGDVECTLATTHDSSHIGASIEIEASSDLPSALFVTSEPITLSHDGSGLRVALPAASVAPGQSYETVINAHGNDHTRYQIELSLVSGMLLGEVSCIGQDDVRVGENATRTMIEVPSDMDQDLTCTVAAVQEGDLRGDLDCSGGSSAIDVTKLLWYLTGVAEAHEGCPLPSHGVYINTSAADLGDDGQIGLADALLLAQCVEAENCHES